MPLKYQLGLAERVSLIAKSSLQQKTLLIGWSVFPLLPKLKTYSTSLGQGVLADLEGGDAGQEHGAPLHKQHRPLPLLQDLPQRLLKKTPCEEKSCR